MNFTQEIKNEILQKKRNAEDTLEFLRGFIYSKGIINNKTILLRIYNEETKNAILKLFSKISIDVKVKNKTLSFAFDLFDLDENFQYPSSFYQGVFMGGGIISNLNKSSYHLQLSSNYEKFIDVIINKLNEYDFNFLKIKHNQKFVAYIKKHEKISDFLKAISVTTSFFNFIDNTISRDFYNNNNRLKNIDASNVIKTLSANQRYINSINYVLNNRLEFLFSDMQIKLFAIIVEHPKNNLNDLVKKFNETTGKKMTKSGIYHWLKKLDYVVNDHKNKVK
ncbi:DNA-binding protein WhiA [Mycoplasmopsis primatum]|uniref:DNA-binding protein WhiA n=1 Tax=Mycoplasmopsis primatum TaxID=55604 RepID=UPI000497D8D8|nr:DNA-binding protein WhiA [Mycoplasmopsis primatum]